MYGQSAQQLLDRIKIIRTVCDLDLLVFFARHPRTILSSDSVASFLGYELKQIADSLEMFLAAGVISRKQSAAHAARFYVLNDAAAKDDSVHAFLEFASHRPGRAALKHILLRGSVKGAGPSRSPGGVRKRMYRGRRGHDVSAR
jgi:hypothetical protein